MSPDPLTPRAPHGVPRILDAHERLRASTAAGHARTRYSGAVGQLLDREITAYLRFGYRTDDTGLIGAVVDELMRPPRDPDPTVIMGEGDDCGDAGVDPPSPG